MSSSDPKAYAKFPTDRQPVMGIPEGNQYHGSQQSSSIPPLHHHSHAPGAWSSGLCDCCSDIGNCCMTCWCPCITFGRNAEILDRGSTSCGASGALYALISYLTGCGCLYACGYRSKMREQYGLQESPCGDCLVHWCCGSCALCQEHRELKNRGFNMTIGWHANVQQKNSGIAMAPTMEGGMTR